MARRKDHSAEEFEALVVDATGALVDELGTTRVSARQIAERIGYTPGALYTHFANLDEIFRLVNARGLAELRGHVLDAIAGADDARDAIRAMGLAYLDFARRRPHRYELMFTPRLAADVPPPALQREIDALFALLAAQLSRVAEVDPRTLELGGRALWSGVHGIASLERSAQFYTRAPAPETDIAVLLIDQFLAGWPPEQG